MSCWVGDEIKANDEKVTCDVMKDITGNNIRVGDMLLYPRIVGNGSEHVLKRGIVVFINSIQNKAWFFEENNFNGLPYVISGEVASKCTYVVCRIRANSDELGEEIKNAIKE